MCFIPTTKADNKTIIGYKILGEKNGKLITFFNDSVIVNNTIIAHPDYPISAFADLEVLQIYCKQFMNIDFSIWEVKCIGIYQGYSENFSLCDTLFNKFNAIIGCERMELIKSVFTNTLSYRDWVPGYEIKELIEAYYSKKEYTIEESRKD